MICKLLKNGIARLCYHHFILAIEWAGFLHITLVILHFTSRSQLVLTTCHPVGHILQLVICVELFGVLGNNDTSRLHRKYNVALLVSWKW